MRKAKNLLVAGAPPRAPLVELTALPRPSSWWGGAPRGLCCPLPKNPTYNIVIVLALCVCINTCMQMHCYFLLNVKQLYLGGGLQLSSAGTEYSHIPEAVCSLHHCKVHDVDDHNDDE